MKKLFAVLMTMIMVFSLAACGGAGNKDDSAAPKTDLEYVKANGKLDVGAGMGLGVMNE